MNTRQSERAAIVGIAESELGRVPDKSALQLIAQATRRALDDAGLTKADVDGVFTIGTNDISSLQVAEYLGMAPRFAESTNTGGSSNPVHILRAVSAVADGSCRCALITYGSTQATDRSRRLGGPPMDGRAPVAQYEIPYGPLLPLGSYALVAQRQMYEYGLTNGQMAEVAVATRKWAMLNPKALMQTPITIDDVLSSPLIASPLHLLDCCLVTDGGGALIVTGLSVAKECRSTPVWILGHAEKHANRTIANMPDLTTSPATYTGKAALAMAGLRHEDVDVAELYDNFTNAVILSIENLGFCKKGDGGDFVSNQRTAPGGEFPMNTNGGGLSYTHPGNYGIFPIIEAVRQLRGEFAGTPRQVENAEIAFCHGWGGALSSSVSMVLGRG